MKPEPGDSDEIEAARRLGTALRLAEGFALFVVRVDSARLLDALLSRLPAPTLRIAPRTKPALDPVNADDLAKDLGAQIEHLGSGVHPGQILVIDCTAGEPSHLGAWRLFFERLNLQRNELAAAWPGPVLVAVHPEVERVFALDAPDLWSVRGPGTTLRDPLSTGALPLPLDPGPGDLVRAACRVLPFFGREAELELLEGWCEGEETFGIRLIDGPGGAGKTRLAMELCDRLRRTGWLAGFAASTAGDASVVRLVERGGDRLLVVDYAETRRPLVEALLEAGAHAAGGRLRLLLLGRGAGEWWQALGETSEARDLAARGEVIELGPLRLEAEAQTDLLHQAMDRFARWTGRPIPPDPPPGNPVPDLPLYTLLSAFAALDSLHTEDHAGLLAIALAHEERWWARASGVGGEKLGELLAGITLSGGADPSLARALALATGTMAALEPVRILYARRRSDGQEWLPSLEPDPLGETLVDQVLGRLADPSAWLGELIAAGAPARSLLTVLTRAAARTADRRWLRAAMGGRLATMLEVGIGVAVETGWPMGQVLAELFAVEGDSALAEGVAGRIPEATRTVELRELALEVASVRLAAAPGGEEEGDQAERAKRAWELGKRLDDVGRSEEALLAIREAVDRYRKLAARHPGAIYPDLAGCLDTLGTTLVALGRREEAVVAAREAAAIRRELASLAPDEFLPDLAGALNNLSIALSELGRREEALGATREAVDLYRALARLHPAIFLPDLAVSLNSLGTTAGALGHGEEALVASREAVDLHRALAKDSPDAFLPGLAATVDNLGVNLSALGRRAEALEATQEAVAIRRVLATRRPAAFQPVLATSLHNLGATLDGLGRKEEALIATREALDILRVLGRRRPEAFMPEVATSLANLGIMLRDLGQREEALAALQEAVHIQRPMAGLQPESILPGLAMSLNNLGIVLSDMGHRKEALAITREAVDLRRTLVSRQPETFTADLAASLSNLGLRLSALRRDEDAIASLKESIDLRRGLVDSQPAAFLPSLVQGLGAYGQVLLSANQPEPAHAAITEAISLLLPLLQANQATYAHLASALASDYRAACAATQRPPDSGLLNPIAAMVQPPSTMR